jgi:SAM-dependent methyltransferase
VDGIPLLFWKSEWTSQNTDVTDRMKAFYERTPFPNYDDLDNIGSLIQKAKRSAFAKMLDEQIPLGVRVLECGCGTGQLSIFLSIPQRTVFGVDMCLNSLRLGEDFKNKNDLNRVHFLQMNLFAPIFKPESFHLVISNGVLHHTGDPFLAFQNIARLVKPGGYILIGLYHKYGRLFTDFRRLVFKISKNKLRVLDSRLMDEKLSQTRKETWFADQYENPHESKHTIGEVLKWFRETGFTFVKSIPKAVPGKTLAFDERLFEPERAGNVLERFLVEFPLMFTGSKEGGFFIVIGKKSGAALV